MVAAYVSNPDNATEWYVNIKSVDWETPRPAVVGSRISFVASFLGRRIAYTYEVGDIVPDELFVMSTAEGPFSMQTTYAWQDSPAGGTTMTLRNEGAPPPVSARWLRRCWRRRCEERIRRTWPGSRGFLKPGSEASRLPAFRYRDGGNYRTMTMTARCAGATNPVALGRASVIPPNKTQRLL